MSEICGCGWYKDDEPAFFVTAIHDAFLEVEGSDGLRRLTEALRLITEDVGYQQIEPLKDLAELHDFEDPWGVIELAEVLDRMLLAFSAYSTQYDPSIGVSF